MCEILSSDVPLPPYLRSRHGRATVSSQALVKQGLTGYEFGIQLNALKNFYEMRLRSNEFTIPVFDWRKCIAKLRKTKILAQEGMHKVSL